MLALWIALVGAVLLAINMASSGPAQFKQMSELEADALAIQVYAYRDAVSQYMNSNTITGVPPFFCASGETINCLQRPFGFDTSVQLPPAGWAGYVQHNKFFIYNNLNPTPPPRTLEALMKMGGGSVFIGRCKEKDGAKWLYSATYLNNTGKPLLEITDPLGNQIEDGAIVMVGRH